MNLFWWIPSSYIDVVHVWLTIKLWKSESTGEQYVNFLVIKVLYGVWQYLQMDAL